MQFLIDTQNCETVAAHGIRFIDKNGTLARMLCRYLHKSHIPITAENILKDYRSTTPSPLSEINCNFEEVIKLTQKKTVNLKILYFIINFYV